MKLYKILHIPTATHLLDQREYPDWHLYLDYSAISNSHFYPMITTSDYIGDLVETIYRFKYEDIYRKYVYDRSEDMFSLDDIAKHPYHIEFQEIKTIRLFTAYVIWPTFPPKPSERRKLDVYFRSEAELREYVDCLVEESYLKHNNWGFHTQLVSEEFPVSVIQDESYLMETKIPAHKLTKEYRYPLF